MPKTAVRGLKPEQKERLTSLVIKLGSLSLSEDILLGGGKAICTLGNANAIPELREIGGYGSDKFAKLAIDELGLIAKRAMSKESDVPFKVAQDAVEALWYLRQHARLEVANHAVVVALDVIAAHHSVGTEWVPCGPTTPEYHLAEKVIREINEMCDRINAQ